MKPANWLIIIIIYTIITMLLANLVSINSNLVIFSSFFGFTFVTFFPGYCLIKLIFPEGKLDTVELAVLSVALSFSIAGISGLFLGVSPVGINIQSITYALSSIVIFLAILVFLKKSNLLNINLRKSHMASSTKLNA